jgi:hypothetical protein
MDKKLQKGTNNRNDSTKRRWGFNFFLPVVCYVAKRIIGIDKNPSGNNSNAMNKLTSNIYTPAILESILESKKINNKEFEFIVDAFRKKKPSKEDNLYLCTLYHSDNTDPQHA